MRNTILKILFFILLSILILIFGDYYSLGEFYFYFLFLYLILDILINRRLTLLQVWNVAFLFIILSEVFAEGFSTTYYSLDALKFLIIANNLIFIGYFSKSKTPKFIKISNNVSPRANKIAPVILILLVGFYFLMRIKSALLTYALGRNVVNSSIEDSFFLTSVLSSLGLILPALIAYYFSTIKGIKIIVPFLISLPVFIILFMGGTRFPLLFSFLGFFIVAQVKIFRRMDLKKFLILFTTVTLLLASSMLMRHMRSSITREKEFISFMEFPLTDLPYLFANISSPEGVIDMTALMFKHFETSDYKLGSSSSFLLYFWIPREFWPEKPTMLGYWLIRDYRTGFGSGHSASFGFTGELYSDFGKFSLILVIFLGRLLKIAEFFKNLAFKNQTYSLILASMIFPYVFFFVRSPITATMNFLGILFFYFIMRKMVFARK